jgi:hypothetical protein
MMKVNANKRCIYDGKLKDNAYETSNDFIVMIIFSYSTISHKKTTPLFLYAPNLSIWYT